MTAPDSPRTTGADRGSFVHASRWRQRLARARPEWDDELAALANARVDRAVVEALVAHERRDGWCDEAHLRAGLRRVRARVLAAVMDRDLARRADLAEVCGAMTALAEIAIGEASRWLARDLARRYGVPHGANSGLARDLVVVGMGKLGGGELNVSSDIDLVFLYAEDGETRPFDDASPVASISNHEFFVRMGRRLNAVLSETTGDGFVFRVDLRLRPDGDAGPLVAHFAMLERYLLASARDWERFAWVKGRIVSPAVFGPEDGAMGRELDALVGPFVYRRYLDFGAIDALRRLHDQIRDEAERREAVRSGRASLASSRAVEGDRPVDVKLGRGGIREVEFIVQHQQMVRGGRDSTLRLKPTLATLAVLADRGLLDDEVADALREAYVFLRHVEHRVQYLDDAQVHVLPPVHADDDRARVAAMCTPLVDARADAPVAFDRLLDALEHHRERVAEEFGAIFGDEPEADGATTGDGDDASTLWRSMSGADAAALRVPATAQQGIARLQALGYRDAEQAFNRLVAFATGARRRTAGVHARERIDALLPHVLDASAQADDPTATLARWLDLVDAIAGRGGYLALLDEFPVARSSVTRLLAASPWAAQYLTRHPLLLDDLLDPLDVEGTFDVDRWTAHWTLVRRHLDEQLARVPGDVERQMDLLREMHHTETFRLLIDDLDGRLTIEALSDQLSALADLVLDVAIRACWDELRREHVERDQGHRTAAAWPAAPAFAVIAFGKLGGKELGYASDLDLVFLYDDRDEPDEAARAAAVERYVRFARRLNLWLTARTTAGTLFEIDLRLRPDGAAGMVVSSFAGWSRYERRTRDVGAWTWEHQALTRARFAAGDARIGAAFEAERIAILAALAPDDAARARLREEIVAMRARMHDGHPNRSGLFDLKHDDGGMVDIEFSVQYLVLAWGGRHRELLDDAGNIALLGRAAAAGLVEADLARGVADAYRTFRARQHATKLAFPDAKAARVEADAYPDERRLVGALWQSLFG